MRFTILILMVLLCVSIVSAQYQQPVFNIPSGTALANNDHPRLFFTDATFDSEIIPRLEGANKEEWINFIDSINSGCSNCNPNYEALSYAFACYALSRNISISDSSYNPPGLSSVCADAYSKVNGISQCDPERHEYANPYGDSKWGPRGCGLTLPFGYTLLMGSGQLTGGEQTTLQNKMRDIHNSASGDTIQYCVPTDSGYEGNRHPYVNSAFPDCFQYDMIGWVLYGSGVSNFDETEAINNVYDVMLLRFLDYQEGACGPDQGDTRYGTKLHGWCDLEGGAYRSDNFVNSALAAGAFGPGIGENYFRTNQFIRQMPEHFYNSIRAYKNDGVFQVYSNDDGNQETLSTVGNAFGLALRMMVHYGDPNDEMTQLADWLVDIGPTSTGVGDEILESYVMNYFVGGSEHFTGSSPDQLNFDLLTSDGRYTMMRSGFSDSDTAIRVDQMKWDWLSTHNKDHFSAIYMDRKGPLFVSTIPTKSGQCDRAGNGYVYGPAFSTVTGFNTGAHMSFNGKDGNYKADTQTSSAVLIEEENNPEFDVDTGDHIAFDEFSTGTLVTGWDYANAYNGVTDATQYMVLFENEPTESFVFEFNHMVDDLEAVKVLRGSDDLATVSTGGLSLARRYKMDNSDNGFSNSDVFVSVAYPLSPSYDDSGSPDWQDLNGNQPDNANPANSEGDPELCRAYYGDYTVRIKSSTEDSFVTVYHLVDVGGSADPVNRLSGTDMVGAVADSSNKDYVAMFSTLNDGELTSTGFTVTTNSPSEFVLAGFEPSTNYDVDVGSSSLSVTSTVGGVLHFESSNTGTLSVSVGGGVAPDPCTDGTAFGTCSSTQPLYCGSAGGTTTNNCQACGCPGSQTCQSDGSCQTTSQCSNGQTQSCSTGLSGVCSSGTQTCSGGSWGSCVQDNQATTEICSNGVDEDCNGADLACATCSEGLISGRCSCGGVAHETGHCCSGSHQSGPCNVPIGDADYDSDGSVDMADFNFLDNNYRSTVSTYDLNSDNNIDLADLCLFGNQFTGGSTGPFCGDGTCNNGETSSTCPVDCGAAPFCGDGSVDSGEDCDDGSSNGQECTAPYGGTCDYCSNSCSTITVVGPFCGDGLCDNGETSSTCATDCGAAPFCGDGSVDSGEDCDDGSSNGVACTAPYGGTCDYCSSGCSTVTVTGPFCGDGSCSDGETSSTCSTDCSTSSSCGNGNLEGDELCDSGSASCTSLSSLFSGGTANCRSDCSGYDTTSCSRGSGEAELVYPAARDSRWADALCNNGDQFSFEVALATPPSDVWMVHLPSGGMCDDQVKDCAGRSADLTTGDGRSDGSIVSDSNSGIYTRNSGTNPELFTANHVVARYCSSDLFTGTKTTTTSTTGGNWIFAGALNAKAMYEILVRDYGLKDGPNTKILITGTSAGGTGVHSQTHWLENYLPTASAAKQIKLLPDGSWLVEMDHLGIFMVQGVSDKVVMENSYNFWGASLDPVCESFMTSQGRNPSECFFGPEYYPHINPRMPILISYGSVDSAVSVGRGAGSGSALETFRQANLDSFPILDWVFSRGDIGYHGVVRDNAMVSMAPPSGSPTFIAYVNEFMADDTPYQVIYGNP